MAEKIKVSTTYIWKVIQRLKGRRRITTQTLSVRICDITKKLFNKFKREFDYNGHLYYTNGSAYVIMGTVFQFADYPIEFMTDF